jgi:hypothetical protein
MKPKKVQTTLVWSSQPHRPAAPVAGSAVIYFLSALRDLSLISVNHLLFFRY